MVGKKRVIGGLFGLVIVVVYALVGVFMSQVEQPAYRVIQSDGRIEVREYRPTIIAEVKVQGERQPAIRAGFRLLADYIFGNNTVAQNIAMTAPVQQQASEKIAMTAPVQQQRAEQDAHWTVRFVMPSEYTMKTLPKPNNANVILKEMPVKQYVVIQFSGRGTAANIAKYEKQLNDYVQSQSIVTKGDPTYAFYNPPWTLPFLRRNEIMMEVASP